MDYRNQFVMELPILTPCNYGLAAHLNEPMMKELLSEYINCGEFIDKRQTLFFQFATGRWHGQDCHDGCR